MHNNHLKNLCSTINIIRSEFWNQKCIYFLSDCEKCSIYPTLTFNFSQLKLIINIRSRKVSSLIFLFTIAPGDLV